ncbi:hypothetical protein CRUP_008823, partial [Coryphaenoides rupestris]
EYSHYRQAWIPLRWLPPESVFEDDFSTKSDVWAFGVLMWEVFSLGELPYTKMADDEVLEGLQGMKLKLPVPEGCPSKISKLMARCWAPSLKERPSFTDVVHALGDLPSDSKTNIPPQPPPTTASQRLEHKNRGLWVQQGAPFSNYGAPCHDLSGSIGDLQSTLCNVAKVWPLPTTPHHTADVYIT